MGSYQFDRFIDDIQIQEINRLNYQSQILQTLEQKIWKNAGLTSSMKVLDLGCGTGKISLGMSQYLTDGSLVGVDRSPVMIENCQNQAQLQNINNVTFQVGNSEDLDFPKDTFDFIYCRLLFQHLSNPQSTIAEIKRVLKPGGIICLVDVDDDWVMFYPSLTSIDNFREQVVKIQQSDGGDPFVGKKLGTYLGEVGFKDISTTIEMITSDMLKNAVQEEQGLKLFLDLFSFGAAFADRHPELVIMGAATKNDALQLLNLPYAWGGFGLFVVVGINHK